ncbi:DHA2 family efflux MFS transporter permease subunit [Aquibacillus koreensis]|uniref:DHA2 family efflux MFS transporter permease subunit n=1 Tax=Aquibacillus koreensis TaxID=279446 RepID=A0A9X4AL55_9BACI|nr:DHA2 family efflux MFS transporter permease subunit [Aquibacillus koreensis]MCT2536184.1 DHA2 family efflux MFS transporter permease subunit [Aquibacillus koreensis]MDC3422108.1 DHA2 family efflux MFS transporter permease subunit [Aquibacillus koreensis]
MSEKQVEGVQNVNRLTIVAVLLAGGFVAILNQTLLATAIPHVMADFGITENTAQWLTTIFMLVNGVMIPITAFLIETFTTRRLFITAMAIFAVGTVICAIAPTFSLLMVGRVVQASGAGIMMPLMMTVFLTIFPIEKRGSAMGMVGLVISFAPAIGPTLSGYIVENYPWRVMFLIVLPIAIIDIIVAYFVLKNVTKQTFPKVDFLSIILSTLGFGGLLYGFSTAGDNGWGSMQVMISLIVGIVSLVFFITRQFKLKQPILEFRVFKSKGFTITTAIGMIVFMSLIGSETILPIYMQNMAGFSALESGIMIMPGAILMGLMSPITGRIFDKIGARWLAITGLSLMTITTFMFTNLSTETSLTYLTIVFGIRMFGMSMVMMPVTTAGLNQLPLRLIPHGTAMNNTMRQVAASIGTAILVTVMTSTALNTGENAMPSDLIHGVNVAFYVASALSVIGLVLSFFIKGTTPAEERAAQAARGET